MQIPERHYSNTKLQYNCFYFVSCQYNQSHKPLIRMKSLTVFTVTATLFSAASAFTAPSSSAALFTQNAISKTSISAAPENFSDVAETISEAASSLRGKTVVVKYGGVCTF